MLKDKTLLINNLEILHTISSDESEIIRGGVMPPRPRWLSPGSSGDGTSPDTSGCYKIGNRWICYR